MKIKEVLLNCFKEYCLNASKNIFFKNWFYNNGKIYNFIFKQNLFVTNIQFREFIDLVQLNIYKDNKKININFMNSYDFANLTSNIIESFIEEKELKLIKKNQTIPVCINERLEVICNNYMKLFESTVIVDSFYTSCIISIPNCLELDIMQVCYQSGYIHSCGESIYVRNIRKTKYDNFVEKLEDYLTNYESCLNLIMYTHEEYPIKNKMYVSNFEKNGLDEIKFYQQKYYMQDMSLFEVAARLNKDERLKGKIRVNNKRSIKNKKNNECIWLIIDRSIGKDLKYPGDKKYYICYKQIYINENPFHIFDEDKPGWINHVTIPHTLAGAMLNIGRCGCINSKEKYNVIDPFVGSGTMYLESLKYTDVNFYGGDICKLSHDISIFNLDFFSQDVSELENISKFIILYMKSIDIEEYNKITKDLNVEEIGNIYDRNRDIIIAFQFGMINLEEEFKVNEKDFSDRFYSMVDELEKSVISCIKQRKNLLINKENLKSICKIWIFITWKTYKRNEYLFNTNRELSLINESFEEFKGLYYRMMSFIHVRRRSEPILEKSNNNHRLIIYHGKYTKGCSVNYNYLKQELKSNIKNIQANIDVMDFLHQFENTKVDLIVTDPPYGFNTIEEKEDFSKLYIEFINSMVKCVKNGGQIIMCLPACSYSGKIVNIFAQKEIVYKQFAIAAEENNMYLVEKKENLPEPKQLYTFPFYWDSEKALRRDIIRFQFFSLNNEG